MSIKFFICYIFLFASISVYAQDKEYAKSVVSRLASPEMKGRGYVQNGDQLAAQFIYDEYEKIGLKNFKNNYFQKYTTSVNSFPGKMSVSIDGVEQVPGKDYLIYDGSASVKGTYKTMRLEIGDILNKDKLKNRMRGAIGKFVVVDAYKTEDYNQEELTLISDFIDYLKYYPDVNAAGSIVLTAGKLTWDASTAQYKRPGLTLKVDSGEIVIKEISLDVEATFIEKHKTQNVVGYVDGERTDSMIVLIAHYDHLGMMGSETMFPGANDNASGIAMLLNLAKHYKTVKPKFKTVFIAFSGEELGLLGAKYFVENPLIELNKIKFLLNFDISGTGDDGIQIVNGSIFKAQFDLISGINDRDKLLAEVKIRGEACNSDHCVFYRKNVPCFFIYTLGGIKAYHDIYDKAETLPLTEFDDYFKLVVRFISAL